MPSKCRSFQDLLVLQISCKLIEIENMHRVSVELQKYKWKFGRTRNAVGTRAAGECFYSLF